MVPLANLITVSQNVAPQVINHYNLFRSTEIDGSAAPGFSSGQAIDAMQQLSAKILPQDYTYEWSGISLEELAAGSTSLILFGLGTLVVYLTLAAQYESFVLPFIILLAVPMALLGALGAQWLRGQQNDVYCQVGLVMLVGLSSKNAILIVEFAEQLRAARMTILDSAIEAARIRLRPILMTSLAFIHGRRSAGRRHRSRRKRPPLRRHHRFWRHDHEHHPESVLHPRALSADRRFPRAKKETKDH